jgi:GNAT superfamily N-acetyltransferase
MSLRDIRGVIALGQKAFPQMPSWTANELKRHLKTFPVGQLVAVDAHNRVIGSSSSLIIDWERFDPSANWDQHTGYGSFSTHDPRFGDTLYGAEICVDPEARGMGIGTKLYEARKALVRRYNLKRFVAGGRIPGYAACSGLMSAKRYVAEVAAGWRNDPVLTFQLANGFAVRGVISGYLGCDEASQGFATLIEWLNPDNLASQPAA